MRLVLDTNIWLDWLVFDDPTVRPLKTAFHAGQIEIAIDPACLDELRRVLAYPEFRLDPERQEELIKQVRDTSVSVGATGTAPLPRCTDPDDQKFLELARDAQAEWLITKDKALQKLGRKRLLAAGFRVGTPQQWAAVLGSASSPV